jgi:hypothetical protein
VIARQLVTRGFSLRTDDAGSIALAHIPPGTYEFWPYRTDAEGQRIYEVANGFAAPISVNVVTGENSATVKFQSRSDGRRSTNALFDDAVLELIASRNGAAVAEPPHV